RGPPSTSWWPRPRRGRPSLAALAAARPHDQPATVDGDGLPLDVVGLVGGQERDDARQVVRLAPARRAVVAAELAGDRPGHVGAYPPRRDGVDPDALAADLHREPAGQRLDAALRGRVRGLPGARDAHRV